MKLFKVDFVKYYDPNILKRILEIIRENNNNIDLIEVKLVEEGIFRTEQEHFFQRNKATHLREFGLYDNDITEIGQLFLNNEINGKELALLFLVKHCNKDSNIIRPFEVLIKVTKLLEYYDESTSISCEEFNYILDDINDNDDETIRNAVFRIINNRRNNYSYQPIVENDKRYYNQWVKIIDSSGILIESSKEDESYGKMNIDIHSSIVEYILKYYNSVRPYEDKYSFNESFIDYIKFPLKNNFSQHEITYNRKEYKNFYPSILYNYLFLGKSLRDIENDVLLFEKNQNGDTAKKILNGFNINTDDTTDIINKGLYKPFENYYGLIICKLKYSKDNFNVELSKMIESYIKNDYKGEFSMGNETLLERIKIKCYEIQNSVEFKKKIEDREKTIEEFRKKFSPNFLLEMTLEDYDYPKKLDQNKYSSSLMYYVEQSKMSLPLGGNRNKIFRYDKTLPEEVETKYSTLKWIQETYPQLSIEEMFELYKKELYEFVSTFNKDTYSNRWKFLSSSDTIKTQLIRFFYPKTLLYIVANDLYNYYFDKLNVKIDSDMDAIQKNLLLQKILYSQEPNLNNYDIEIIGEAIYSVWTEINANRNEKIIDTSSINIKDIYNNIYQDDDLINDIVEVLSEKKNIILTGTPGVGKTFTINDIIKLMELKHKGKLDRDYESRIKFTQFHQNYGYEEFVEGMTLNNNKLEPKTGIFKYLIESAIDDDDNNYYMVIDEINRGNVSKIFGELLMCIEDDKRSPKYAVSLMYSDSEKEATFYVPKNVYIIGTMNTADRSLAQIDYALRRRFSFFPLKPGYENEKFINTLVNCKIKDQILGTMKYINNELLNTFGNNNFDIGHSYFAKDPDTIDEEKFKRILKYDIIPLLFEYMSDMDEIDVIKKFRTSDSNCKIFNDILNEKVPSNAKE